MDNSVTTDAACQTWHLSLGLTYVRVQMSLIYSGKVQFAHQYAPQYLTSNTHVSLPPATYL
jgi:hypothetical protein